MTGVSRYVTLLASCLIHCMAAIVIKSVFAKVWRSMQGGGEATFSLPNSVL